MTLLYVIIGVNALLSIRGFSDYTLFEQLKFRVGDILHQKDWKRIVTSGFLHVDYTHLFFNMYALYMFGPDLFSVFSPIEFVLIYMGSLIAGNLLALFIHSNHYNYTAVGASGAVSGIIYSHIILFPHGHIGLIFIPGLSIPSWIFGLLYILYTIFGIKSQRDNIGHEAHLGGAIAGLLLTVLYLRGYPFDYKIIGLLVAPTLIFLYLIAYHPEWLLTGKINWSNSPLSKIGQRF